MLALEEVGSSLTSWPCCRPCEEAAARLLRVAARRSLCRFLVLLCSSSPSSSISPSASQAQLAKSTAGAIFRLCGRGSKKLGHGGPKIGLVVWRGQVGNGKFCFSGSKAVSYGLRFFVVEIFHSRTPTRKDPSFQNQEKPREPLQNPNQGSN